MTWGLGWLLALSVNVMRNFPEARVVMGRLGTNRRIHSGVHPSNNRLEALVELKQKVT